MKVFLIQTPSWGLQPPIGLAQLGAYLIREGHDVTAFDVNIDLYHRRKEEHKYFWSYDQCFAWVDPQLVRSVFEANKEFILSNYIEPIVRSRPCVAGFSINYFSFEASLLMARYIKEADPRIPVVFGGEYFTIEPDWHGHVFRHGVVDAVVVGDGEETFAEFVALTGLGKDVRDCKGLCLPVDGKPCFTPRRPFINLDKTPIADYTLFGWDRYPPTEGLYEKGDLLFMTSRGCVRACTFCSYRVPWPGYRTMGGDRIFAEIKHQSGLHGPVNHLKFYDLLINGNMKELSRLCDRIIGDDAPPIPWRQVMCVFRPEMTYDALRQMKKAGCEVITYGLESGSQKVMDLMRKRQTVAQAESVLKATRDAGIDAQVNIMTGYPGETEEDLEQTLGFLRRNKDNISFLYPSFTFTVLEANSPLNRPEEKQKFGIEDDHPHFWSTKDGSNVFPERMRRYRMVCEEAKSLGIEVNWGLETEYFMTMRLAEYYEYRKDYAKAIELYGKCLETDPRNEMVQKNMNKCRNALAQGSAVMQPAI